MRVICTHAGRLTDMKVMEAGREETYIEKEIGRCAGQVSRFNPSVAEHM